MNTAEVIALLGVSDEPTTAEVRVARRQLAKRIHPDLAGDTLHRAMAEVNAGCDRLIRAIREGRIKRMPPPRPRPVVSRRDDTFRPIYAVATVALMAIVLALTMAMLGASATSVAVGSLLAAIVGGAFVATLLVVLRKD